MWCSYRTFESSWKLEVAGFPILFRISTGNKDHSLSAYQSTIAHHGTGISVFAFYQNVFCFYCLDNHVKILVVPDAYRHLNLRRVQQVVVDSRIGSHQIAEDICRGVMHITHISKLVLLVMRVDIMNNEKMMWVLDHLSEALDGTKFTGQVVVTGTVPAVHDRAWMCQKFQQEAEVMKEHLREHKVIHYSDAADVMYDQYGVIPQLLDHQGLMLDGRRELAQRRFNI